MTAPANDERVLTALAAFIDAIPDADRYAPESPVEPRLSLLDTCDREASQVAAFLAGRPPVRVRLGRMQVRRGPAYETLSIPVESDGLRDLHKKLVEYLHVEADFDPRIDLIDVVKGTGRYLLSDEFAGLELTVNSVSVYDESAREAEAELVAPPPPRKAKPALGRSAPTIGPGLDFASTWGRQYPEIQKRVKGYLTAGRWRKAYRWAGFAASEADALVLRAAIVRHAQTRGLDVHRLFE